MFNKTSTRLLLLVSGVIVLVLGLSITMTLRGNNRVIELQARKMAQTVANQVIADRAHYVKRVVSKVKGTEFAPKEGFTDDSPHVPLPATFVMGVAEDVSSKQNEYRYSLVSKWNINPSNNLKDGFLNEGFNNLVDQEKQAKAKGDLAATKPFTDWQPYAQITQINGKPYLRFLAADVAAGQACVTCHNNLEQRNDVLAIRSKEGVERGRTFQLNDLMGAVAVDVNLEEAGTVAMANTRYMVLVLAVAGVGCLIFTYYFINSAMTKPITAMIERLKRIADGDLTQRVEVKRRDEFGELADSFNVSVKKLHDTIVEVETATHEVASAATQISASSDEMAKGISEQTQQVTQVSAAVEQMSASIVEVARKSGEAANNAGEAGRVAAEGGHTVDQTIEGMRAISEAVSASAASVTELGKRGEQIGQIIDVINDIADQTNLLALNAAIEAARAGEHGRGFAVVADEVRKLADRTTKATAEVAESIKAIQTETGEAVQRMNAGTGQVQSGVERATQAGKSLGQIVNSAKEVAGMIQSIAAAAEEQSAASEEVSRNVELISSVTRQTNEGANQAASAASQLSAKAEQLQTLIGRFQVNKGS